MLGVKKDLKIIFIINYVIINVEVKISGKLVLLLLSLLNYFNYQEVINAVQNLQDIYMSNIGFGHDHI